MTSYPEIVLRLLLASVLGGAIGLEREIRGREAGVRTYLLVSLGSALIMIVSEYVSRGADPTRIAAQAISGIGFLGGGVILRYKDSIRGLTTAACMWVVCPIGLAIGSGHYVFGCSVSVITILSLIGLKSFEKRLEKDWYKEMVIVSEDTEGQFERVQKVLHDAEISVANFALKKDFQKNEITIELRLRFRSVKPQADVLRDVFALKGIKSIEFR